MFRVAIVLWTIVLTVQPAACIVNKKKNISSQYSPHFYPRREYFKKKSYLDTDRPLWVLDDKVNRLGEINIAKPRYFKSNRKFITPATYPPKLPSHYLNLNSAAVRTKTLQTMPRNHKRTDSDHAFPVFDDFEVDSEPILIYRGPKAEMIFNTMMNNRQYPMKEPVPGQVMYPPYSPKFKPTPVVDSVRSKSYPKSVFHNVTLIPFYAHEAVDPRQINYEPKTPPMAEVPISNELLDNHVDTSYEDEGEPPCYHSYYSQDDVQAKYWSIPISTTPPTELTTTMSLNRQLGVPNDFYPNHRMEATTPMPKSDEGSFRILYETETEAPMPPKPYKSVHTAKYGGFKTIYPIYTLNNLLTYKPQKSSEQSSRRSVDITDRKRKQPPEETWLIWNSRYKNPQDSKYLNPTFSKFLPKIHQTAAAALDTKIIVK